MTVSSPQAHEMDSSPCRIATLKTVTIQTHFIVIILKNVLVVVDHHEYQVFDLDQVALQRWEYR
jgi:hypothetical protein